STNIAYRAAPPQIYPLPLHDALPIWCLTPPSLVRGHARFGTITGRLSSCTAAMLPPHRFYYLHNFQRALQVVASRCADLLDPAEQEFIRQFAMLPQAAQALFVRMAMRRGPWFRASRLVYEEIPDVPAAAGALAERGWLDAAAPMTLDELFGLCTLPELRAIFAGQSPASARKSELLETLRAH